MVYSSGLNNKNYLTNPTIFGIPKTKKKQRNLMNLNIRFVHLRSCTMIAIKYDNTDIVAITNNYHYITYVYNLYFVAAAITSCLHYSLNSHFHLHADCLSSKSIIKDCGHIS